MEAVAKSDAFFFITSIAVIIGGILMIAIALYLIRILRDIKQISNRVREETNETADDLRDLRTHIKEQGASIALFSKIKKLFRINKKGRRTHANHEHHE